MDKSNSTIVYSPYTKTEKSPSVKEFVKELKVCTLDPARYLQRCIAVSARSNSECANSSVTPNAPKELKCLANPGTLRNICFTKRSFLSEKPDTGMITNIITSRAPGNYYNYSSQTRPNFSTLSPSVNTNIGGNCVTNPPGVGADNISIENPKKLLLQMLKSAVISARKKHAAHLKLKKRNKRKKRHLKNKRASPHGNAHYSKDKKSNTAFKASETNSKTVSKIMLPNVTNQIEKSPPKKSNMINKMLEETEEMLRITFLSNIHCFSGGSSTQVPEFDLLEKSDNMSQLITNFISKMIYCAKNINTDENNRQSGNTFISTTVTRKSKGSVKKSLTNSQSRVSNTCKRKDSSTVNVRKPDTGRDHSQQGKSKTKLKKDKSPCIGFGRPGKDDTEEAELAHCTIQPDPPSAISAPYREPNSSTNTVLNSPQESTTSMKCDAEEEKASYTSSYLQRFRDPILDHGNKTKLLPQEYNSQITYVCPSTELNLKVKEVESAIGNGDRTGMELSAESRNILAASVTSVRKPMVDQKCKTVQSVEKKASVKANISRAIGRMVSKNISETRSLQQRKVSDTRNKLSDGVVQARRSLALRSNNKQIFKKQSERKLCSNSVTKVVAKPRASSSFTSGGLKYTSGDSRYQCQQRFTLPAKDIRLNATATAERRFFNRNEHLLSLSRPKTRYVEDTKQRYGGVLDPYHVRNLNTIIFCNQAEETRLKRKEKALVIEERIQGVLRNGGSRRIFEEIPRAPITSDTSSTRNGSEHSFCTETDTVSNLTEYECLEDIPTEEMRHKSTLSITREEPENLETVDKFYMSIAKIIDKIINISTLTSGGKEVACGERIAQELQKIGSSVAEVKYKVGNRFQVKIQTMYVDEIKNENEDHILVLRNKVRASEEPDCLSQNAVCISRNLYIGLPHQLYKSIESVAPNISTFITVLEIKPSKLLKEVINYPNVLNFVIKFSKVFDNSRNNSVEYTVSDNSMKMMNCSRITDNIISLLPQKVFENIVDKDIITSKKRIIIATTNRRFGVDEGHTEVFCLC